MKSLYETSFKAFRTDLHETCIDALGKEFSAEEAERIDLCVTKIVAEFAELKKIIVEKKLGEKNGRD